MRIFVFLILAITINSTITLAQQSIPDSVSITFKVIIPESTPEDATIFWAGSLNHWDPGTHGAGFGQKEYARPLTYPDGNWTITIKAPKNSEESYKYTRGSIYSAEEQADYTYRPTRNVIFDESKTIVDTVEAWHDLPPKSLTEYWPLLKLKEADITIMNNKYIMDGTHTILYDQSTGAQFYDFKESATKVKKIPENFYDVVYYYQKISATTNDLQLITAAKTAPEGPWTIFVDQNGDKKISTSEKAFKIHDDKEKYDWSEKVPVREIRNDQVIIDSVRFSIQHAHDLPSKYSSSPNTNAPDLTFKLPYKNRQATLNGQQFYISAIYFMPFNSYHQLLIDHNQNDTLEVGSGSNEVYSTDFSQMRKTQKYFTYPTFKLGDKNWQIANIDPHGKWVRLRPATNKSTNERITIGKPAPNWQATTVNGDEIGSEKLEGSYVLLDFWGSWCGPCIEEIPLLQKVYHQFKNQNLQLVGFAYESETSLDKALKEYQLSWPQILDQSGKYSAKFLVHGYPTHFLIGPNGKILEKGSSLRGEQLIPTLEKYLK
ncbi:redoxin domain-containing protein [Fodinibius sp. N2]|uniref:redoxin domain-containing protein n=1 Tax=Fodinibius alkaliphilus TaxID=3140241 RepID=UPI00315A39DA